MSLRKPDTNSKAVFSTHPSVSPPQASRPEASPKLHTKQTVKLRLETKGRGGKAVTVVYDVLGELDAIQDLARALKTLCGAGGTVRRQGNLSEIEIQGDHRPKVAARLREMGFNVKGA